MAVTPAGAEVAQMAATNWKKIWKQELQPQADKRYYKKKNADKKFAAKKDTYTKADDASHEGRERREVRRREPDRCIRGAPTPSSDRRRPSDMELATRSASACVLPAAPTAHYIAAASLLRPVAPAPRSAPGASPGTSASSSPEPSTPPTASDQRRWHRRPGVRFGASTSISATAAGAVVRVRQLGWCARSAGHVGATEPGGARAAAERTPHVGVPDCGEGGRGLPSPCDPGAQPRPVSRRGRSTRATSPTR